MKENPLIKLESLGQSIWLDYLRRALITSGQLQQYVDEDGLSGMTSNPKIFEKAIAGSHDYDDAIRKLAVQGKGVQEIYEALTVEDVQMAADVFRPTFDRTEGRDGFVSLEVSPYLAHDTQGGIKEARRLFAELNRPNVFIKIPGTLEGIPAIQQCISEGINVNITLLFGLPRYQMVMEAYLAGLEQRLEQGKPIHGVASVASFFLSRIDVLVDPMLEKIMQQGGPKGELAGRLHGQVAIASARIAYQMYKETFGTERFRKLEATGARTQKPLWASTSTKNPAYSDVKYVEALIGRDTINTIPVETLEAYRDHGNPALRLEDDLDLAREVLDRLLELGIDIDQVTQQLEDEGVQKFIDPYDELIATLTRAVEETKEGRIDGYAFELGEYEGAVQQRMTNMEREHFATRLWRKDASPWKSDPKEQEQIRNALGWLHVAEKMDENVRDLVDFAAEVRKAGFQRVVHMGMGGSSLTPLVFQRTFPVGQEGIPLTVLDTTDPATILRIERVAPVEDTLFIVASKSGTTAEPEAFDDYFYAKVKEVKGDRAGENFVAITDPGTLLAKSAKERGFRRIFLNFADIGGRYSALSYFGLVPAALMGLDLNALLSCALKAVHASAASVPFGQNPGMALGAVMGELAKEGRDKVTFLLPDSIATLGWWLEQLLAESTGKDGTGLLPVAGEPLGAPSDYGKDRLFVRFRLASEPDGELARGIDALRGEGHPVVNIEMERALDVGQEFFRWEIATATAGAILGINAFNQPNVQESKDNTNRLLAVVEEKGQLPEEKPVLVEGPLSVYAVQDKPTIAGTLGQFLEQGQPGDYVALMAYLPETPETETALQSIRTSLRDGLHLATTLGYGPRFLHSTGQFHKGGPNTGLFIQLTCDDTEDAPIPGRPYTFGTFKRAQALGDLEALRKHGRRAIRIHVSGDLERGLAMVTEKMKAALKELQ